MRLGEVEYVDVVSDTGAVGSVVIRAKDVDGFPLSLGHLQEDRNQVGFGVMAFTDTAFRVRSRGVEVAEGGESQSVRVVVSGHHLLADVLALAIGIYRILRVLLVHGDIYRIAIGGAGGGEDEVADAVLAHRLRQIEGGSNVIPIVPLWRLNGFPNRSEGGEVHDRVNRILLDELGDEIPISNITFDQ